MNRTLNDELKRVQTLLEENNNSLIAIVVPRFLGIANPHPKTNVIELNCTHSSEEKITAFDWAKIVSKATEINKQHGGKASKNASGDIMSGRLIAIRNGQGLAVGVLKENLTREEVYSISNHKTGYTLSFVLPTHSKKQVRDKDNKPHAPKPMLTEMTA